MTLKQKTVNGSGKASPEKSAPRQRGKKTAATQRYMARDETVGFLLWDARRTISKDFEKQIAPHGVSLSTFWILRILWDEDGLTQSQLIQRVRMKGPTIVGTVAQLEREGLVTRSADDHDSRKKLISLTPKGSRLRDVILPITEDVNRRALKGFAAAERNQLKVMLRRLRANMLDV